MIVLYQPESNLSGSTKSLEILSRILEAEKVYTFNKHPGVLNEISVVLLPGRKISKKSFNLSEFTTSVISIRKVFIENKNSLGIINSLISTQFIVAALTLRKPKLFLVVREIPQTYFAWYYLHFFLAKLAGLKLVYLSKKTVPKLENNPIIIPNSIDAVLNDVTSHRDIDILVVAPINYAKGSDRLLEVLRDLNYNIVWIGRRLQDVCDDLLSQSNVRHINETDEARLYVSRAKILLHLSRFETYPRVIMEGSAFGAIPVSLNVGATIDLVSEIGKEFILNQYHKDRVIECINVLLKNTSLRNKIMVDNYNHILERNTHRKIRSLWLELIG
jgi:glycosyltransferase involved in cell wall biosynthesis